MSKVTFQRRKRPQEIAVAWLDDAGEVRPAVDVLRSNDPIGHDLRIALADWIRKGCKRVSGARVPGRPWTELPPSIARKLGLPSSPAQHHAYRFFLNFPLRTLSTKRALELFPKTTRGRPRTMRGAAIDAYVKHCDRPGSGMRIHRSTAARWFDLFKMGSRPGYR